MKNILTFIFICITFSIISQDSTNDNIEFWLKDNCPAYIYNDILKSFSKTQISFYLKLSQKYKEKQKTLYKNIIQLYFNDFLYRNCIEFDLDKRVEILDVFKKYKEWNEKAIAEQVTLEKEISQINCNNISWKYLSDSTWHKTFKTHKIYFIFFSQNTKRHQIYISFPKVSASSNSYITNNPETIYLDYEQILILEKLLSEDYINAQIEIAKKEKQKADTFK